MIGNAIVMSLAADTARPDTAERLGQLFDAHHGRLYSLARRLTRSTDDARDVVQDTFLRAARSPQSIPWGMPHEEAWLVRVLINICRDGWRKQAVRSRAAAVPPPVDRHGAESELVAHSTIWRGLESLPPRRRAILVLYELEGAAIPAIRGFSVVLVVGAMQATSASDNVPEAARKALADMKDFLPYKRYQLLDAAWMVCCGPSTSPISGRVRGPDARDFLYSIDTLGVADAKLNLRFSMRELQDAVPTARGGQQMSDVARLEQQRLLYEAIKERDDADIQYRSAKKKFDVGAVGSSEMETASSHLRHAEERVLELQRGGVTGPLTSSAAAGGARSGGGAASASGRGGAVGGRNINIMDSTFSIAVGETVVIGTSRLNGDQALIAILTAAPKPGAGR
jgi:RNA polymerase sigma factor (sigma-70 family)